MLPKQRIQICVLIVFVMTLLGSCAPQSTLSEVWFRRLDTYVSASEAPGIMDKLGSKSEPTEDLTADISTEDVAELVSAWANAKYEVSNSDQSGFTKAERLTIPYGFVGVLHIGNYTLVLPPRTYTNVPMGDDEIKVTGAVCVASGFIAWKYNYRGQRVALQAQDECYLEPVDGWEFANALRINQGELAWRFSSNGSIEILSEVGVYPAEFHSEWNVEKYVTVKPGETAYRMLDNGSYEFLTPQMGGVYPKEIDSRWIHAPAVQIGPSQFGIYLRPDGKLVYLPPGIHYEAIESFVNKYPLDEQRYRTLSVELYEKNKNPDDPACKSFACGAIIDKIVVQGTQRLAEFNVDVGFKFVNPAMSNDLLEQYRILGDPELAVQNFIEGPARDAIRASAANMTQDVLETEVGKKEYEDKVKALIEAKHIGIPIEVTYVNVRSRNFNDSDQRAAAVQAEVQLQREQDRIAIAQTQEKAIEAETETILALQKLIQAKMESINFIVDIGDGVSCTELALLHSLEVITVEWDKLPENFCSTGNTSISVTAP